MLLLADTRTIADSFRVHKTDRSCLTLALQELSVYRTKECLRRSMNIHRLGMDGQHSRTNENENKNVRKIKSANLNMRCLSARRLQSWIEFSSKRSLRSDCVWRWLIDKASSIFCEDSPCITTKRGGNNNMKKNMRSLAQIF